MSEGMTTILTAYGAGAFFWAFLMGVEGSPLDKWYLFSMVIWPLLFPGWVGRQIRRIFR